MSTIGWRQKLWPFFVHDTKSSGLLFAYQRHRELKICLVHYHTRLSQWKRMNGEWSSKASFSLASRRLFTSSGSLIMRHNSCPGFITPLACKTRIETWELLLGPLWKLENDHDQNGIHVNFLWWATVSRARARRRRQRRPKRAAGSHWWSRPFKCIWTKVVHMPLSDHPPLDDDQQGWTNLSPSKLDQSTSLGNVLEAGPISNPDHFRLVIHMQEQSLGLKNASVEYDGACVFREIWLAWSLAKVSVAVLGLFQCVKYHEYQNKGALFECDRSPDNHLYRWVKANGLQWSLVGRRRRFRSRRRHPRW